MSMMREIAIDAALDSLFAELDAESRAHWRPRVARALDAANFSPTGDNHHNAAACPHCSPRPAPREITATTFQIIRCKVCGEQMREYDHGHLGCSCERWGSDVATDNNLGIFDEARHEVVPVIAVSDPRVLDDAEVAAVRPLIEGSGQEIVQKLWVRLARSYPRRPSRTFAPAPDPVGGGDVDPCGRQVSAF